MPASRAPSKDGSGNSSELGVSEPTISDNELLCQLQVGFRAELDIGSSRGEGFYVNWLSLDLPRDGEFIEP